MSEPEASPPKRPWPLQHERSKDLELIIKYSIVAGIGYGIVQWLKPYLPLLVYLPPALFIVAGVINLIGLIRRWTKRDFRGDFLVAPSYGTLAAGLACVTSIVSDPLNRYLYMVGAFVFAVVAMWDYACWIEQENRHRQQGKEWEAERQRSDTTAEDLHNVGIGLLKTVETLHGYFHGQISKTEPSYPTDVVHQLTKLEQRLTEVCWHLYERRTRTKLTDVTIKLNQEDLNTLRKTGDHEFFKG